MTHATLTVADFLLARIGEDERAWRSSSARYATHHPDCDFPGDMPGVCDCGLVDRILAECEAKRRIVKHCTDDLRQAADGYRMLPPVLEYLALPYADHPDFRDKWRP